MSTDERFEAVREALNELEGWAAETTDAGSTEGVEYARRLVAPYREALASIEAELAELRMVKAELERVLNNLGVEINKGASM